MHLCECFIAYWYHVWSREPSSNRPYTERNNFSLLCCEGIAVWPRGSAFGVAEYFLSYHFVETVLPKVASDVLLERSRHIQAVLGGKFTLLPLTGSPVLIPLTFHSSGSSVCLNRSSLR